MAANCSTFALGSALPSFLRYPARSHARHVFVGGGRGERAAEGAKAQQPKLGDGGGGGRKGKVEKSPTKICGRNSGVAAAVRKAQTLAKTFERARREVFFCEGVFYGTRSATA